MKLLHLPRADHFNTNKIQLLHREASRTRLRTKKKTKRSYFDRKTRITLITPITSGFYYDGYRARVTNRIRNQGEFVTRADRRYTRRHQPASFC